MPERPLLILPNPESTERLKRKGFSTEKINRPGAEKQREKFAPKFNRLKQVLDDPKEITRILSDPLSIAPERAIVFEVAGTMDDFYHKAQKVGLEYLGEEETVIEPDKEEFYDDKNPDKEISGRIYLSMPDVQALKQLIRLRERYLSEEKMYHRFGKWAELFDLLKDVRPWGPKDRIPNDTIAYWKNELTEHPNQPIRFEAELWFREKANKRKDVFAKLFQEIAQIGGRVIHHSVIEEIRYDGVLVDLPSNEIQTLIDNPTVHIAMADDIMFVRPQSMAGFNPEFVALKNELPQPASRPLEKPIAALLDGVPVQNHALLQDRIVVDDPDGFEELTPVANRLHGTAMTSLILHGDRNKLNPPIRYQLYIRPVMYFHENRETAPENQLVVDVIYRAILRIKEGDPEGEAVAPKVFLINLSLGDLNRPFTGSMSPWARLIDFLSCQYNLLFIISAGNIKVSLPLPPYKGFTDFDDATAEEREQNILIALNDNKSQRTILSPSEAMNALTIGAWHSDSIQTSPSSTFIDPWVYPNVKTKNRDF